MNRSIIAIVAAMVVLPAWASNPGEPLDGEDWVFVMPGLSGRDYLSHVGRCNNSIWLPFDVCT